MRDASTYKQWRRRNIVDVNHFYHFFGRGEVGQDFRAY